MFCVNGVKYIVEATLWNKITTKPANGEGVRRFLLKSRLEQLDLSLERDDLMSCLRRIHFFSIHRQII